MSISDRLRGRRLGAKAQDDDEEPEDEAKTKKVKAQDDEDEPEDEAKTKKAKGAKAQDDEDEDEGEAEDMGAGEKAASPGRVAQMCADAGVPRLARRLIDTRLGLAATAERIAEAVEIKELAARLGGRWPAVSAAIADELAAKGTSLEAAKATFLDLIVAAQSPEIRGSHMPGAQGGAAAPLDHGWSAAIAKVTGQGNF